MKLDQEDIAAIAAEVVRQLAPAVAQLVAAQRAAVEKTMSIKDQMAYIMSITDRKQRKALLAEFNRRQS